MKNGDGKYSAPNGEHVNSIFCKESNGTPVLMSMFKNIQYGNIFVNIYALQARSRRGFHLHLCKRNCVLLSEFYLAGKSCYY